MYVWRCLLPRLEAVRSGRAVCGGARTGMACAQSQHHSKLRSVLALGHVQAWCRHLTLTRRSNRKAMAIPPCPKPPSQQQEQTRHHRCASQLWHNPQRTQNPSGLELHTWAWDQLHRKKYREQSGESGWCASLLVRIRWVSGSKQWKCSAQTYLNDWPTGRRRRTECQDVCWSIAGTRAFTLVGTYKHDKGSNTLFSQAPKNDVQRHAPRVSRNLNTPKVRHHGAVIMRVHKERQYH